MEIDILNDLLNRTISNLFTNKEKHLSYFSTEDDEYLSDDMKVKNDKDLSHTQVFEHGTFENIIGKNHHQHQIMNPIIEEKKEQKEQNITPEIWRNTIGKKKFENSMQRLNVDEKKIKNLQLSNLSLDALQKEKAKVKNELKKYDSDFNEVFNYLPTKQDKEIMKPLYIYYKSIKNAIEKKEVNNEGNSVMNPRYSQVTYSVVSNNSDTGNIKNNNYNNYHQQINNQNNNLNQKSNFNYHKKANSSSMQNKNEIQDIVKEKKRSLSKDEINALEREYKDIKKEQKDLKDMLRNYQNEFQKSNNRKVKFLKDITPVEREYQKYKSNRQRLNDIMEIIESNKKK